MFIETYFLSKQSSCVQEKETKLRIDIDDYDKAGFYGYKISSNK